MSIRVDNNLINPLTPGEGKPSAAPDASTISDPLVEKKPAIPSLLKEDTVTFLHPDLKEIEVQLFQDQTPNPKVAAVRAALANGQYSIDAKRVAEKLLAFELQRDR